MSQTEVDDLVVHLEESMEMSSMEQGVKLVGTTLSNKPLNKWGGEERAEIIMGRVWGYSS